jgi:hypothetical protein
MLIVLLALFLGPTKLIPIAVALATLYAVLGRPGVFVVD